LRSLARWLDTRVAPRRAAYWCVRSVRGVLENRVYLGEAFCGDRRHAEAHEALVTAQQFEDANRPWGERTHPEHRREHLLVGLVRCAGCRHCARTVYDKAVPVYCCPKFHGSRCSAPIFIRAHRLHTHVVDAFLQRLAAGDFGAAAGPSTFAAETAVKDSRQELRSYRDASHVRALLNDDLFLDGLKARKDHLGEAETALARARRRSVGIDLEPDEEWASVPFERRQSMLVSTIDAVVVRQGAPGRGRHSVANRTTVYWRGEAPELRGRLRVSATGRTVPRQTPTV
jgi:hypothetical protein